MSAISDKKIYKSMCNGKIKNATGSPAAIGSRNAVGPQMVGAGHVAAGSGTWVQPVPVRDGCWLPVPQRWLVPGRETHGRRAGDRDMDRNDMQRG